MNVAVGKEQAWREAFVAEAVVVDLNFGLAPGYLRLEMQPNALNRYVLCRGWLFASAWRFFRRVIFSEPTSARRSR